MVLAYIGDAVFEIFVRSKVLFEFGNAPVNKMHKRSREMVKAKGQSDMYFSIQNLLTDEEEAVFGVDEMQKVILCLKMRI